MCAIVWGVFGRRSFLCTLQRSVVCMWDLLVNTSLVAWQSSGIDVDRLLAETSRMSRSPAHRGYYVAPQQSALIDTRNWKYTPIGSRAWVPHHNARLQELILLMKMTQKRVLLEGRHPLPPIRFIFVLNDGHGILYDQKYECTCTSLDTCCNPQDGFGNSSRPPAPVWSATQCVNFGWDVSVPHAFGDFLPNTYSKELARNARAWHELGIATSYSNRKFQAFFVGDRKAYRTNIFKVASKNKGLLHAHEAVSVDPMRRIPFETHINYSIAIYAHGFHFYSARWRRLALLGGTVIAEESPCKEWWQMMLKAGVHYVSTKEDFSDLEASIHKVLNTDIEKLVEMAEKQRVFAKYALSPTGLTDYIETLWRMYASLTK